jgi:hypothetical protein
VYTDTNRYRKAHREILADDRWATGHPGGIPEMKYGLLAEPLYAISERGEARLLPAGLEVERVNGLIKSGPDGSVVVLAKTEKLLVAWYVNGESLKYKGEGVR